ncbi:MAG: hypothetical protein PVI30_09960 [Myxococcales bacterium]
MPNREERAKKEWLATLSEDQRLEAERMLASTSTHHRFGVSAATVPLDENILGGAPEVTGGPAVADTASPPRRERRELPPHWKRMRESSAQLEDDRIAWPAAVPSPEERLAAQLLIDHLTPIAQGRATLPSPGAKRPPEKRPAPLTVRRVDGEKGGARAYEDADGRAVLRAFEAYFGYPLGRRWEELLAWEMTWWHRRQLARLELEQRHGVPQDGLFRLPDGQLAEFDTPCTAGEILARVRAAAGAGGVPDHLTAEVIEVGLESTTIARGGRGRLNVETWIQRVSRPGSLDKLSRAKRKKGSFGGTA